MKKLFTIILLATISSLARSQTPIFFQNFNNGAISSYVNDAMPEADASHLNAVQNSSANFARSITTAGNPASGRLQLYKNGSGFATGAWISRTTALKNLAPTFLKIQFTMNVSGTQTLATSYNAHGSFVVGSGDDMRSVFAAPDFPSSAATHSMFYFYFPSPASGNGGAFPGFSIVGDTLDIVGQNPVVFSGDQQFTIMINNSGSSATYTGPTGATSSLGNDKMDVWVGNTLVFDEKAAISPNTVINGFKFSWSKIVPNGAILQFDDLTIYDESVATLPVTFTSFSAKQVNARVELNWQTATEQNNSHFELLRSQNAVDFNVIGKVKSKGDSRVKQEYVFNDNNPYAGVSYYKLRQLDNDGTVAEFPQIKVVDIVLIDGRLKIIKTFDGQYFLSMPKFPSSPKEIVITDVTGKKIYSQKLIMEKGNNSVKLGVNLQKGVYVAVLKGDTESMASKFLIF